MFPPPSFEILSLERLPPIIKNALILPDCLAQHHDAWYQANKRAIMCLSKERSLEGRPAMPKDMKGHIVTWSGDKTYAFCTLCHVARRARDAHFICAHACTMNFPLQVCEGDYIVSLNHIMRLHLYRCKRGSMRPRFTCVRCEYSHWATAPTRQRCAG